MPLETPVERGLQALLAPRSIALVGASADRTKLSGLPLFFLQRHGYSGALYPINPRAVEIGGLPCYPSLGEVGAPIDLAFLLVGAKRVLEVIDDCLETGVGAAIVAASGFAEVGGAGGELQTALAERIQGTGLRVLGPNCMGMVNILEGVAASFSQSLFVERLIPGALAFFSQSGAIGGSTLDMAFSRGIGLSHWVSTGNQVDVDVVECAAAVVDDPAVQVIGLYLEGLRSADAYCALLQRARSLGKRVLVLKSGQSEAGAQAAVSHTAAMVGNAAVFGAVSRQYGAILVNDLEELLDRAAALLAGRRATGPGVGVVSSSGGVGVIIADEVDRQGLCMASFSAETRERLTAVVPEYGSTNNPVDATATLVARMMGGESGLWTECFANVADDPTVDVLLIGLTMITGQAGVTLADEVIAVLERTKKPVLVSWLGADLCHSAFVRLRAAGVPMFSSTARAVRAATALVNDAVPDARNAPSDELAPPLGDLPDLPNGALLTEWQCQPLLRAAGIPTPASVFLPDAADPGAVAALRGPFVVKAQSARVLHKSDVGAVLLPVDALDLASAVERVSANAREALGGDAIDGVLVQEMVQGGVELVVSVTRDPDFGLILSLGIGGTLAELLKDVASRRLPVTHAEIVKMIGAIRGAALLHGHRGRPEADAPALVEAVTRVACLGEHLGPRLDELEINPLLVLSRGRGVVAADCLIRTVAAS